MPEQLRDDLDQFAVDYQYDGRSEVIREACTRLLSEFEDSVFDGQRVTATVTVLFGYDEPSVERELMDIRHEFDDAIRSASHDCLGKREGCVQTFVVLSEYRTASSFISRLGGIGPNTVVKYVFSAAETDHRTGQAEFPNEH